MSRPRIPPLRIIEDEPVTSTAPYVPPTRPKLPTLGYVLLIATFLLLATGMICSQFILPTIHVPLLSIVATVLSFPVLIFSVIKLA